MITVRAPDGAVKTITNGDPNDARNFDPWNLAHATCVLWGRKKRKIHISRLDRATTVCGRTIGETPIFRESSQPGSVLRPDLARLLWEWKKVRPVLCHKCGEWGDRAGWWIWMGAGKYRPGERPPTPPGA